MALLSELRRGAVASTPSCLGVRGLVETFDAWTANDEATARDRFARVAPVLLLRSQYSQQVVKAYLRAVGTFSTEAMREAAGVTLDAIDRDELLRAVERAETAVV